MSRAARSEAAGRSSQTTSLNLNKLQDKSLGSCWVYWGHTGAANGTRAIIQKLKYDDTFTNQLFEKETNAK